MEIEIEYMEGEEREGFYVQPIMKRAWAAQLEVLKAIDMLCKRRGIKYFAQWGTLLGAVRHQGFIPWDDDMDLAMLREDYERFQYYAKTELPDGWQIHRISPTLIRIVNSSMIRVDQEFLNQFHGCPYMVGIDLFCMDYIPSDKADEELYLDLFWAVCNLYVHWELFEEDGRWDENKWMQLEEIENITGYHFDRQSSVKEQLYTLADGIAAMYWDAGCKEVTFVSRLHGQPEYRIPRSCFDKIIEVPFENTTIPILEDYDLLCRLRFGDNYMTPIREDAFHDYPFFRDQIDTLRDYFEKQGMAFPECFDMAIEQETDV